MIAYKFLAAGRRSRFTVWEWPPPGTSVQVAGPLVACANGIHACHADALAYWLDDELWAVELEGEIVEEPTVVVARRSRLVRQIEGWPDVAPGFAQACSERVQALTADRLADARIAELAQEAAEPVTSARSVILVAYAAAVAGGICADGGFDAERLWQSQRLASLLGVA